MSREHDQIFGAGDGPADFLAEGGMSQNLTAVGLLDSGTAVQPALHRRVARRAPADLTTKPLKRACRRLPLIWLVGTLLLAGICGYMGLKDAFSTHRRIDQIKIGMRVAGRNPDSSEVDRTAPEPDEKTWQKLRLQMTKKNGDELAIELLRPAEWVKFYEVAVGETIDLDLAEMGAEGPATVLSLDPCPHFSPGSGNVVTGTFAHRSSGNLLNLRIAGEPEPIGVTRNHRFWSEDRQEFVEAGELQVGEQLLTSTGDATTLLAKEPRPSDEQVYNLEVHREHVYLVGNLGVLVHNQYGVGEHDIALGYYKLYYKHGHLSTKAIGESVESLRPFADRLGAKPYWEWGDLNPDIIGMKKGVLGAANRAVDNGGKIHFNLDGFRNKGTSFRDAVVRGRTGTGTITERELSWILDNETLRNNTVFYRGGKVVLDPSKLFGDMW